MVGEGDMHGREGSYGGWQAELDREAGGSGVEECGGGGRTRQDCVGGGEGRGGRGRGV